MVFALQHKAEGPKTVSIRFDPYGDVDPAIEYQRYYIAGEIRRPLRGNRIPEIFHRHSARILSSVRSLPDVWYTSDWIVNGKVRDIIESFEPGKHQFVPLMLRDKDNRPLDRKTYVLHPVGLVECIIPELSEARWAQSPLRQGKLERTTGDPDLTLDKAKIGGRHMWMDPRYMTELFISEALCGAFQKAKVRGGWDYRKHREI